MSDRITTHALVLNGPHKGEAHPITNGPRLTLARLSPRWGQPHSISEYHLETLATASDGQSWFRFWVLDGTTLTPHDMVSAVVGLAMCTPGVKT